MAHIRLPVVFGGGSGKRGGIRTDTPLSVRVFSAPHWLVAGVLAVLPGMRLGRRARRAVVVRRRRKAGLCEECGYDLRATPERCPECGLTPRHMR